MIKPVKKSTPRYDYHECRDYLQKKHGYDERNYAGKTYGGDNDDAPYQDFWHWIAEMCAISNDSAFVMYEELSENLSDENYKKIILNYYMEEFGEGKIGDRAIEFWVSW